MWQVSWTDKILCDEIASLLDPSNILHRCCIQIQIQLMLMLMCCPRCPWTSNNSACCLILPHKLLDMCHILSWDLWSCNNCCCMDRNWWWTCVDKVKRGRVRGEGCVGCSKSRVSLICPELQSCQIIFFGQQVFESCSQKFYLLHVAPRSKVENKFLSRPLHNNKYFFLLS
jgi:hypothetical protein